jgi:hypothetical protein
MWAHYAQNHTGFVLEFDAEAIEEHFEDIRIKDVTYTDAPDPEIEFFLKRAATTMKARHAIWLQQMVIAQAYYSKFTPWQYEEECRLVASEDEVEHVSGQKILFVPTDCLSTIIVGKNASEQLVQRSKEIAARYDVKWLQSNVGKSTWLPFFTAQDGSVLTFRDGKIAVAEAKCAACSEPVDEGDELCPWCKITAEDSYEAARANPLRAMAHFGILDGYLKSVEAIERGGRRGRRKK